jgi:hypothetical protein
MLIFLILRIIYVKFTQKQGFEGSASGNIGEDEIGAGDCGSGIDGEMRRNKKPLS